MRLWQPRLMKRPGLFFFALTVGLNLGHSPHGWIYDRAYDACMATAGDDDWKCEDFMPNPITPGPRQPAPGAV